MQLQRKIYWDQLNVDLTATVMWNLKKAAEILHQEDSLVQSSGWLSCQLYLLGLPGYEIGNIFVKKPLLRKKKEKKQGKCGKQGFTKIPQCHGWLFPEWAQRR